MPKGIKRLVQRIPSNAAKHRSDGSGAFRLPGPYPLVLDALKLILARREERRIAADLCEPRERTNNGCREPKEFRRPYYGRGLLNPIWCQGAKKLPYIGKIVVLLYETKV